MTLLHFEGNLTEENVRHYHHLLLRQSARKSEEGQQEIITTFYYHKNHAVSKNLLIFNITAVHNLNLTTVLNDSASEGYLNSFFTVNEMQIFNVAFIINDAYFHILLFTDNQKSGVWCAHAA